MTTTTKTPHQPLSWFRRIVPMGYHLGSICLTGTAPLLMKSGEYDRESETYKAFTVLGSKRGKSADDKQRLRELEWALGLYFDSELGPYIPGKNVKELLRSAATKYRKGEDVKRSLVVIPSRIPLMYEGPRDQAGLWAEGYEKTMMIANAGPGSGRVDRCRPMFSDWGLVVEVAFDPEDIDPDLIPVVVERSQKFGLGDYRPEFGSFGATWVPGDLHKAASNGDGLKPEDRDLLRAHVAFCERIMSEGE